MAERCMRARILRPQTSVSKSYHVLRKMYIIVLVVVLSSTSTCDPPPDDEDYSGSGSGSGSDFSFSSSMPEGVTNVCDTDQLEVTTNPMHINAFTHKTYCSLLVNAPNNTAISVSVLDSGLNNVHTYFYIEKLDNQIPNSPNRINLVSLDHTPCVETIQGNQFRFHFQNTNMKVVICAKEVETSACYGTVRPLIEATPCRITLYKSKIQTSQRREDFQYNEWWSFFSLIVTQYQAKCTCGCPDTCKCTLAYRQWLSVCINSQGSNTIRADLIVYEPTIKGLSFANTGLNEIQHNAFIGLTGLKVLILSHNNLLMLQPTICQNLPELRVLKLDNNKFTNLTSDSFTGILYLQFNELTYLPHDLFHSTTELRYLDLTQNRLEQISSDLFKSLQLMWTLYLSGNAISNLPIGVFDSLLELTILDLSGNAISNLSIGVFDSLGRLVTLNLSGNAISKLPVDVFDLLGWLSTLDLSGNAISNLPEGVFDSLGLRTLDLSGNGISNLPVGVFDSLDYLRTLELSNNNILFLPDSIFITVGKKARSFDSETNPGLKMLSLRGNNISKLHVNIFESLTGLFMLDTSHNNLYTLPKGVFNSLRELKTLDLSNNRIEVLPSRAFYSQQHLLILDLSNNELFSLPGELFLMPNKLISLNLCCNNLTINASKTFESLTQLKILDMSKNSIEGFPTHSFEYTSNLLSLEISHNNLRKVPVTLLRNLSRLTYLNMSMNSLSSLPSLNAQGQLKVLDVSENQLNTLKLVTFENLKALKLLSVAKNFITSLHSHLFFNLDNIEFINVSYNAIKKIDSKVFSDETKLKTIDLRGNEMYKVTPYSFTTLTNSTILVDKHATCCFLNEEKCISMAPRPEYLTCNRMLRDVVLRISVWVLGLSAFICNVIAYCVRSRKRQANVKVQTLLISHLALSDLLMGVNMLILAIADVYYDQYFPSYARMWRQGFTCKFAGFLSILSSEGSVFFITLISIDRMLGIKYPFGGHRLETKSVRICVACAWLTALLISVIPISLASDNGNFYSISEVCIGIPIVRRHLTTLINKSTEIKTSTFSSSPEFKVIKILLDVEYSYVSNVSVVQQESAQNITYTIAENTGSQVASIYSIVVFIAVNFCCFVIVACCYVYIFIKAKSSAEGASRAQVPKQARNEDLRMARKMFAIVFTDFCCWVPLSFVCILTQSGAIEVSPEMYAWTVGFILPINSSINPFLYVLYESISDHLKKKQEKKKNREEIEMQVRWKPLKYFGLRFDENK